MKAKVSVKLLTLRASAVASIVSLLKVVNRSSFLLQHRLVDASISNAAANYDILYGIF